jgi:hypothetical protein
MTDEFDERKGGEASDATFVPTVTYGPDAAAPAAVNVLSYAQPVPGRTVAVCFCANEAEAELRSGELDAAGIPSQVVNTNVTATFGPYIGGSRIEVHVMQGDVERAAEVLKKRAAGADDELEPEQGPDGSDVLEAPPPTVDDEGEPVNLAEAAVYDNPRLMREAAVLLESARVSCWLPRLVPRGDKPAGRGRRFVVRVRDEDVGRARAVLAEAEEEARDSEEPRCPKCASWQVAPVGQFWQSVWRKFLGGRGTGAAGPQMECLQCRHRWPAGQGR